MSKQIRYFKVKNHLKQLNENKARKAASIARRNAAVQAAREQH